MDSGSHIEIGPGDQQEAEPTVFFMMNCLMYSRLEAGLPSNQDYFDEDVNVYLANLLASFINPAYHERSRKYLSQYDTNLFQKVQNSSDVRLKYSIYKTNADFLLISIGIFQNPNGRRPGSKDDLFGSGEEVYMGRAKQYYRFAYSYSQKMFRRTTGVTDVLEKLSRGFEQYVQILSHMRGEYFNILDRLTNGDVYHLERKVDALTSDKELKALQDQFLDMYSEYLRDKTPEMETKLRELARRIHRIDESFHFDIEKS